LRVFVLNSGSSSIKYKLFLYKNGEFEVLESGVVERIGEDGGCANHKEALKSIEKEIGDFSHIDIVAHRVVHGGDFSNSVVINSEVLEKIEKATPLAPLHNPSNLIGIYEMLKLSPNSTQIAIFDTAFHQSLPAYHFLYAISKELSLKYNIKRYGFHGISNSYLLKEGAKLLEKDKSECNFIILHLGNGASVTAIKSGKSFNTSMGFTPLEGLVMGSRCGDIDAGVLLYLQKKRVDLDKLLNYKSGLKGLCGTNDIREITKNLDNPNYALAFDIYIDRIRKYIGAYLIELGRVDAIIFSGGVGENSSLVRERVCQNLEPFGIELDYNKNREEQKIISTNSSQIKILKIKTDEELEMAKETVLISTLEKGKNINGGQ